MRKLNVLALSIAVLAVGCAPGPKSPKGFLLPDGDVARGRHAFIEMRCYDCHEVAEIVPSSLETASEFRVVLGGEVTYTPTDGDLVTSIINPSYRLASGYSRETISVLGRSNMRSYNGSLTVRQLTDLVAFLHSQYKVVQPEPRYYH